MLTPFQLSDVITRETVNQRINEYNAMFPLKIEHGGTGATTIEQARKNLGVYSSESINFSGDQTLTLSKSIREYSYVAIYYRTNYDANVNKKSVLGGSTYFTVDALSSTTTHALSEEISIYPSDISSREYLVFASAIMRMDGNGYNINLERNTCMIVDVETGTKYLNINNIPHVFYDITTSDFQIKIYKIVGFK